MSKCPMAKDPDQIGCDCERHDNVTECYVCLLRKPCREIYRKGRWMCEECSPKQDWDEALWEAAHVDGEPTPCWDCDFNSAEIVHYGRLVCSRCADKMDADIKAEEVGY